MIAACAGRASRRHTAHRQLRLVADAIGTALGDWPELVEHTDRRMYAAKTGGRNRAVLPGDEVIT